MIEENHKLNKYIYIYIEGAYWETSCNTKIPLLNYYSAKEKKVHTQDI